MKFDIIKFYDDYLYDNNKMSQIVRKKKKENRHSASSAGLCAKKEWYEKHHPELKQPFEEKTLRVFQIGNLIGEDIEKAMYHYKNTETVWTEEYIYDEKLNVGGSFDLFIVDELGVGYLYDYKTANMFSYNKMFGAKRDMHSTSGDPYRFQLGTYAYILEKEYKKEYGFSKIGYMALIGYDKNFSSMIEQEVSTNYIEFAERYWKEAGPIIDNPIEPQQSKVVPYNTENSWDCKYCNFNKSCDNPINPLTKGQTNEKKIAI